MTLLKLGSRKSRLALQQTHWVMDQLSKHADDLEFDVKKIVTKGDKILDVTLSKVGGKGLFVKEIENALYNKDIDIAVHSMKDLPSELPEGLDIICVPTREDDRDAFISQGNISFMDLPEGAVVGTSSLRRGAQILAKRPDLHIKPVRGNIETRLRKLEEEDFDAIVLAAAGLKRMGWSDDVITEYLPNAISVPAVGQGALAIEARSDDEDTKHLLESIHDPETAHRVAAERSFLKELEGSCQVPIGAYCERLSDSTLKLTGMVGETDGSTVLREEITGDHPVEMGVQLADRLKALGAKDILDRVKEELDES
ncbi:hydroxymethylbilane synthase [Tuberibacillus sp. Marseille-P3662]|uniref:hydroxymethylbilane synthase n=1 Tax=Tuberibacillus sp. Marseille-P3662 TaxID=1965358 RepID=UPI000A1C7BC5|nr:hydroxymethylbilane synthase [Tuberibacillus sp. Marseille-P3662]